MLEKMEKFQLVILSVILAAGLIFATSLATGNLSKDVITVTGSSYKNVTSDSGRFEFRIMTRKPTKAIAYDTITKQIPQVKEFIKAKGFEDSEIDIKAPNGYYTYKTLSNGYTTNEIEYYNISQPMYVTSNDVQKIKDLSTELPTLINKGIDIDAYNPQYFYSKLADDKVEMLGAATKDAKDRAASMLKATNNRVGKIQSVKMGVFQITPVDSTNVSDMGISDTSSIEKKITSVANVTFRIK